MLNKLIVDIHWCYSDCDMKTCIPDYKESQKKLIVGLIPSNSKF